MEKNITLFNIADEHRALMAEIEDAGGELTDELAERLDMNAEAMVRKAVGYGHVIKYYEGLAAAAKSEKDRVAGIQKMAENAVKNLKARIVWGMQATETEKIEDPTMRLSLRASTAVEVPDPDKVPDEFCTVKVERVPDKAKIKAFLAGHPEVAWAQLKENKSLQIK